MFRRDLLLIRTTPTAASATDTLMAGQGVAPSPAITKCMRVKNWNYRELRERIADGIALGAFTNFYREEVPKHDALNRSFNRVTPATLKASIARRLLLGMRFRRQPPRACGATLRVRGLTARRGRAKRAIIP